MNIVKWFTENADWLVPAIIAYLTVTESLPFLPTKANGIIHALVEILKKTKGGAAAVLMLLLSGCVTINNSALSGEKNAVKTDAEATPSTSVTTTGTIPLR